MSAKNRARKSTGTRGSSVLASPQASSTNRAATQPARTRNQTSSLQSTAGSSRLSSQPSTSRAAAVDSDDDDQPTLRLSNGRNRNTNASESASTTTSDSDEAPGRVKLTQRSTKPTKKRRIVRRKNSSSEASDVDVQPSTSSKRSSVASKNNQSLSSPNKTTILPTNLSTLVNKCVYYLLVADQKKTWIKKTDIQNHVFAPSEYRFYKDVLSEAVDVLQKTYGLEMTSSQKRKGEYMLINALDQKLGVQDYIDYSPREYQKRGFTLYLLTLIFMNERLITNDELASALKPLGIDLNDRKAHPLFGDVNKLLKELAHQNYLEYKVTNKDPPQYELAWGVRAYQEVDKKDLLQFACQVMGDTRPEDWILQYNDATNSGQELENADGANR